MNHWTTANGYIITQLLSHRCNVFLVSFGGHHLLVDSSRKREREPLIQALKDNKVEKIDFLVLTHTHFDHTENAAFIQREYDTKVIVHENEANFLAAGYTPIPPGTVLSTKFISKFIAPHLKHKFAYEPCQPDMIVKEKLGFQEYGFDAYLVRTPGHTKGSMSLIVDNEFALVGDSMFGMLLDKIFPPYGEDVTQIVKSWGVLLDTGCRMYLPSHGTANSRELVQAWYDKLR